MRRVVVTGLGLVTPLGCGVEPSWQRLLEGRSGVRRIDAFEVADLPARIAGVVPRGNREGALDLDRVLPAKDRRRMGDFMLYAITAAREAIRDAAYRPGTDLERERAGVMIGSGIGGLPEIERAALALHERGPRRISPYFIPSSLVNEASGVVSIEHGLRGPNHAVATACATGAHALGDAARMIQLDDADVMLAGGTEAAISRLTIAGFAIMQALSTSFNDAPETASRPWDRARDGFVLGEGAGVVVLEELEHARRRGARIHAELLGYGLSGDAHHITAPDPDGAGAARAMRMALKRARLPPASIDYVNAHATSTPLGDPGEVKAVKAVLGAHAHRISMSSTKSATGHLLGAAGAVEAIFSVLSLRDQVAPPTLNLEQPSEGCDLDLVPRSAKPRSIRYALSNSFAFGGANVALVFGKPD
ncbi:MAG TPA: beta-ketoacyl-ACP synthase II [Polyangiaceae bacterium]